MERLATLYAKFQEISMLVLVQMHKDIKCNQTINLLYGLKNIKHN